MTLNKTGYPSIDRPWLNQYPKEAVEKDYPKETPYQCIKRINSPFPDKTALMYFDRKISYQEFFANIEQAAAALEALGVQKGDSVYVTLVSMPEVYYIFYGANKIGAVVNFIDPRTDSNTLKHYMEIDMPKVWITLNLCFKSVEKAIGELPIPVFVLKVSESMPAVTKVGYYFKARKQFPDITYNDKVMHWKDFMQKGEGKTAAEAPAEWEDCSIIQHTGGSTGTPKSVRLSGRKWSYSINQYLDCGVWVDKSSIWYQELPPFVTYGLLSMHAPLLFGGFPTIVNPQFSPKDFPKQYHKYHFGYFLSAPEHFRQLVRSPITKNDDFSHLRLLMIGGEGLPTEEEDEINAIIESRGSKTHICKGYAMTETSGSGCVCTDINNKKGSVGLPLPKYCVKIMDPDDITRECKYNETGEIWFSGPNFMIDYLKDPEATDEIFVTDEDGTRWVRTSDLGYMDEEGFLFVKGRMRRIYITDNADGAAKIFPQVPENAIRKHPDVVNTCCAGRLKKDSSMYEIVAFTVKKNDRDNDELTKELEQLVIDNCPTYMYPCQYEYINELPLLAQGKVDFRKLEEMAEELRQ